MKTAFLSGIRGQMGAYLSDLLLEKDYKVIGLERRVSSPDYSNIEHLLDNPNFILEQGDICDFGSLTRILKQYKIDEAYNLAAQSHVHASWAQPISTAEVNYMGVCNFLEAIRLISPSTKFYQSSTSECFGDVVTDVQNEESEARPRSPYAAAKLASEGLIKCYKDSYGLFACYSRNFNFESPKRGKEFVTRKITDAISAMIAKMDVWSFSQEVQSILEGGIESGTIRPIHLGNLDARRDWSHAADIARGIWMMMQEEVPDYYVFASGETRSIKEFLDSAFSLVGVDDWSKLVVIDPKFYRPAEVNLLCGDASKARNKLHWKPEISFDEMVSEMISYDLGRNKAPRTMVVE